jgi:branched-subunit amino acid aminotransferase/4-amino-4-deoxychorismate lyase
MISINGTISKLDAFNWLKDSGFRYGYGCFETMRFSNNTIRHLNLHAHRLTHGLRTLGIDYDPSGLHDRIHGLSTHLTISTPHACHVSVTGGPVLPTPNFLPMATEIISFSPMPPADFSKTCELLSIQSSEYSQLKSLSYMHHIQALRTSNYWPIYIDSDDMVIDASIFSIGMIVHNRIIFAKHPHQLPSVSKQVIMRDYDSDHRPIQKNELAQAPVLFGCNALRGAFPIHLSSNESITHPMIDTMNEVLGFDGCDFC